MMTKLSDPNKILRIWKFAEKIITSLQGYFSTENGNLLGQTFLIIEQFSEFLEHILPHLYYMYALNFA